MKDSFNQGERPDLFFWRDSNGNEVDAIAERGGKLNNCQGFLHFPVILPPTTTNDRHYPLQNLFYAAGSVKVNSMLLQHIAYRFVYWRGYIHRIVYSLKHLLDSGFWIPTFAGTTESAFSQQFML